MIVVTHKGDFRKTENFLKGGKKLDFQKFLHKCGKKGVSMLAIATPARYGNTAASWGYEIKSIRGQHSITWTNSNINKGFPVAIMIQLGHGTGTGGFVSGRDYINPAMKEVFDQLLAEIEQEVKRL